MIRTLIILGVILGGITGIIWVSEQPGSFGINWLGYDIQTPAWVALSALVLLIGVAYILISLIRILWKSPERLGMFFLRRREVSGYEALSRGFVAVAAGEETTARRFAELAERKLNQPALTRLLNAQAAQLSGDSKRAESYFSAMLDDRETAFLGHRGLIVQALRADDKETALDHAQKALALRPKAQWVNTTLFDLQTDLGRWPEARQTLSSSVGAKVFGKDVARRRKAVLLVNEARRELTSGQRGSALERAAEAVKLSPGLVPAATLAAQLLIDDGAKRKATKLLVNAWHQSPHPDLAAAYLALDPEEAATAREKRVKKLISHNPDHLESRLLQSEIAIESQNWVAARAAISGLAEDEPNARICTLMATIEKGEGGSEQLIRAWLARALTASPGPQWSCSNCSWSGTEWRSECPSCNAFDSLDWRVPEHQPSTLALPSSILPLLTGPDVFSGDQSAETADEAPPAEARDITGDEPKEVGGIPEIAAEPEEPPASSGPSTEAPANDGPVRTVDLKEPPKTQTPVEEKPAETDDNSAPVPQLSQRPDDPGPRKNGNGGGVPRY